MIRSALITGIFGQDGSYLAEHLLTLGWSVHGLARPGRRPDAGALAPVVDRISLHPGDLTDRESIFRVVQAVQPERIFHLGGQSQPALSFKQPLPTAEVNALGTLHLLDACKTLPVAPRFFHASSSQIFGRPASSPQNESTPVRPLSPYAASKAFAADLVRIARETGGLFAVNGICFNHESPRRPPEFVTAKICRAAAAIRLGRQASVTLGDLSPRRDWSDARDFVRAFWLSLEAAAPDDYVFGSGVEHSVQDVVEIAFGAVGLEWRDHVRVETSLLPPADTGRLVADASKARRELGWEPQNSFRRLIEEMTCAALAEIADR